MPRASKPALVWAKSVAALGRQDYQWRHEACFYDRADGTAHSWFGDPAQTTVLEFDKPARNADHPTMKPVALFAALLRNSCPPGGSGTSLIAAEQEGRTAALLELDPKYCDVIVARFETFTGTQGRRVEP